MCANGYVDGQLHLVGCRLGNHRSSGDHGQILLGDLKFEEKRLIFHSWAWPCWTFAAAQIITYDHLQHMSFIKSKALICINIVKDFGTGRNDEAALRGTSEHMQAAATPALSGFGAGQHLPSLISY